MGAHVSVPMYKRSLPQRLRFEGGRCSSCGRTAFPLRAACVSCGGREFESVELSGSGTIASLTRIDELGAPPEFSAVAARTGGYHVAIVRLDEGPSITGQMVAGVEVPTIGSRVRAVTRRLYEEEGVIRYGFKFALDRTTTSAERGS